MLQNPKNMSNPSMTAMHLVEATTAEAQTQTRVSQIGLNKKEKKLKKIRKVFTLY